MQKAMYTYAWDLQEEGVKTVAARLRDAGLNTVTLATSYHAGKFLRPHAPRRKVFFPEDGTILCTDLGDNYGLSELAIETPGWQAFRHGHHHEFELIELSDNVETMLGTCFCTACRSGAKSHGVDIDDLAQKTHRELELFFADGTEPSTDAKNQPDWQALHTWRAKVVASLVSEVREALNPDVTLAIIPTVQSPNSLCWSEGSDLSLLASAADRLEIPVYQTGLSSMTEDVKQVCAAAGSEARLGYILRPSYPNINGIDQLRDAVKMITKAGAKTISFYNYGHIRLQSLDWIKGVLS
jgi:hypothetical protein